MYEMQGVCIFTLILAITKGEAWNTNHLTSKWEHYKVRKAVDASILAWTGQTDSVLGCSAVCIPTLGLQATSFYYVPGTGLCHCNTAVDTSQEDPDLPSIIYGALKESEKEEDYNGVYSKTTVTPFQPDCLALYDRMFRVDGVYVIQPIGGTITDTWCDMANSGWTVILRRVDGSENFNRSWSYYELGFGNRIGEYWLGLENIHQLTKGGGQLIVELEAFPGANPPSETAFYASCVVGDRASKYELRLVGYSGSCSTSDSLSVSNGMRFSTFDSDNDLASYNCAKIFLGGWWHAECHFGMLTGAYYKQGEYDSASSDWAKGIHWHSCWKWDESLMSAVMKIKR